MATKIKLRQLENSATAGSIIATDSSNIQSFVAPSSGVNHLWGYETGGAGTLPVLLGTNLSYDAPTNTLNATAGAGGYSEIQEESGALTARTKLAFLGSAFTAADDAGNSRTTVSAAAFLNTLATAGTVGLGSGNISGTLAVANGGTGATTLTGLLQGNGTGAFTAITNSTTVGQVLRVTASNTYAWGALDLADADAVTGVLPATNGGTGQSSYAVGDILFASTTTALSKLADVATGNALISGGVGVAPSYGKIGLTTHVSGILPIANGGTGSATQNFVDLTNAQSIGGAKTFTSNITITATPSAPTDAATVGFVTTAIAGIRKGSVRVATTANGTIGTAFANGQVVDTITLVTGDLILLKNQTAQAENGVYTVNASGAPTRATWMDSAAEIDGVYVAVEDGSQGGTLWITVSEVTTLGTDAIVFTQIQTSGSIGGSAAINKVAYGSGANTLTSTTNFHFESGQLCIGTATLETNNVLTTRGGGSTSVTFGYRHLNAGGNKVFSVADNGTIQIGAPTAVTQLSNTSFAGYQSLTISAGPLASDTLNLTSGGSATTGVGVTILNSGGTKSFTSGNYDALGINGDFTTTTGTGTYRALAITGIINQSAGGTGITRGIHINQTLTTPADYRALELTANSSHYALFTTAGKIRFDFGTPAVGDILTRDTGGEEVRIAAGTAGYVLTSNGAGTKPTYQAVAAPTTVTRGYLTTSTASVLTLSTSGTLKDVDGNNIVFTTSGISADKIFVVRNGVTLSQSGTVSRDYTLNTGTSVLTLATALTADEDLLVYKIV